VRAELLLAVVWVAAPVAAQERSGPVLHLEAPTFTFPREGATEIGVSQLIEGEARPLVEVVLFDRHGAQLGVTRADGAGRWAVALTSPAGPNQLAARARFSTMVSAPAVVHFTLLRDDAVEGGGCSMGGGLSLVFGVVWLLRRRRR
jgi:hypothetical protein